MSTRNRFAAVVCIALWLWSTTTAMAERNRRSRGGRAPSYTVRTRPEAPSNATTSPQVFKQPSLVENFIVETLEHPDPSAVLLSERLKERLSQLDPNWSTSDEAKEKAVQALFSPESYKTLGDVLSALQRSEYNNSAVLGEAGVGKTHLTDALTAMLSFGLLPEDFKKQINYGENTSAQRKKMLGSIIGNTDIVLVDNSVLGLTNTKSTQPWGDSESRMKATLTELFAAAKKEYDRKDSSGKRVGHRTIFLFEEIATLPPLVSQTLKTLEDSTGYHDPDRTDLLKKDPGYSVLAFTTPDEWRKMVAGDSAVERRYNKTQIYPPDEDKAFNIVRRKASQEWEDQHGLLIDDEAIKFLINNRKFLTSPPLAMPASVLAATNDLFTWKGLHPGSDPDVISTQDAKRFLMDKVGITSMWFEGPNGEPPFHDFEKQVQARVVGHDDEIRAIAQVIKTWAKFGMAGEPPLILLGGPSGSGKDTILTAINQVLFGHDGKKLNFSLAGAKGFGVDAFLEGPPVGNHSDHSIGLLAQALDTQKMGVIGLNEGADLPSQEYEKFKVMIEAGELRPKGNDVRARPLLFPIFLMGQWGEEVFEGKSDAEIAQIDRSLTQDQIESFFLKGKKDGTEGAIPFALLQRAKKSGGIFLIRPVAKADYGKVVALNVPPMVDRAKRSSHHVELTVDPSIVDFTSNFSQQHSSGTRGLGANTMDFTLGALSKANDEGLDLQNAKVNLRHERVAGVDYVVADWLNAPDQKTKTFRMLANSLYRHGGRCNQALVEIAGKAEVTPPREQASVVEAPQPAREFGAGLF